MAKMFYTLDEAAELLGKSVGDVREMAKSGQIQEFRDRDKLMFKVEQIDLLAHDDVQIDEGDMSSMIPLADDDQLDMSGSLGELSLDSGLSLEESGSSMGRTGGGSLGLEESGSAMGATGGSAFDLEESGAAQDDAPISVEPAQGDARERTGVSIFDADELDTSDPAAVTQITSSGLDNLDLDSIGSGSGLLDLTRESDDTSLGAEFLEELYPGDEQEANPNAPGGGLFETGGDEAQAGETDAPLGAMVAAEPLDGPGSGLAAGLSIGAVLALAVGLVAVIMGLMGAPANALMSMLADNFVIVVGSLAGVAVLAGLLGLMLGKRSG